MARSIWASVISAFSVMGKRLLIWIISVIVGKPVSAAAGKLHLLAEAHANRKGDRGIRTLTFFYAIPGSASVR
jgi:hypothetical protein